MYYSLAVYAFRTKRIRLFDLLNFLALVGSFTQILQAYILRLSH